MFAGALEILISIHVLKKHFDYFKDIWCKYSNGLYLGK